MKFKLKQDSKHMIHAEEVGSAEAYSMFLKMLNPKSREKNFTWDKLQGMVLAEVEKHLFVHYNSNVFKEHKEQLLDVAKKVAIHTVEQCLWKSGVESWLPIEERKNDE